MFTGSSDDRVGHPGYTSLRSRQRGGLAAVLASENTPAGIFRAMRGRSTYATTGERILLDARLNGERMGRRVPDGRVRKIACRVAGTAPIDTVDLIKNGKLLYSKRYLSQKLEAHVWVQLNFESSTEMFSRANPRGARLWKGSVTIEGAKLLAVRQPEFANPVTYQVERDPVNRNLLRVDFNTRGRGKALLLELDGASPSTEIRVALDETEEQAGSPGAPDRSLETLPAAEVVFRLAELRQGVASHEFRVVNNIDRIQVQLVPAKRSLDQEFEYTDRDNNQPGDYYYVRVRQIDGAMAWSSPFWVGRK